MRTIIGCDPGEKGSMAVVSSDGKLLGVNNMPETPKDILDFFKTFAGDDDVVCYLEDVGHGMPGQSSKATATFARHNGHLEMALLACGIRTVKVTPQKWQRKLGMSKPECGDKDKAKRMWKNKLKARSQELFPNVNVTLTNADSLLIADYGRKQELGLK